MNSRDKFYKVVIEKFDHANNKQITTNDIDNLLQELKDYIRFYAYILHDQEDTRLHYHLVLVFYNEVGNKKILTEISKILQCNINCISVRVSRDLVHDTRYLTHKDNTSKHKYLDSEVVTSNFVDYDDLTIKQINPYKLDFNSLYAICKENRSNIIAIYDFIGLNNAVKYKRVIEDILQYLKKSGINELPQYDYIERREK